MPLPATYGFDDTIDTLSSNFTAVSGSPRCDGSSHGRGSLGYNIAVWNADTPDANHYAELVDHLGGNYGGPCVRFSLAAQTGYMLVWENGSANTILRRFDAGTPTDIATGLSASGAGVLWRLEAEGTTIRVIRNGSTLTEVTDSTHASGNVGWMVYDGTARCDSWEGGNLASGPVLTSGKIIFRNRDYV